MKSSRIQNCTMVFFGASVFITLLTLFAITAKARTAIIRHPIHVTLTNVDYNAKTHSLEISCKIFMDDFEAIVNRINNVTLRLGTEKEHKDANTYIFSYLKQHLKMSVNGKVLNGIQFLGKELEVEAVWMYIEIPLTGTINGTVQSIHISNTLLLDLYDDQSNLMNLQILGKRRSALFRKGKENSTITFD